ncbi:DMT family transporter [Pyrobaculum calidifontis]|uniref:EamA domain-containing protein n=1 Tax=Pyrobaculum calidifontis (strain DSM 21063 / JCM 11548 / VA1) TaxID=410359 RepID=A3MUE3_PYRCJ|nr:DMT family transporter [Pyrobaculum calidifontis]ABO08260.1 protein of unknown function DUF6, transmembrane [Pyrobaculum calidifontis JCM 11548]
MDLLGVLSALAAATIWGLVIFLYKRHMADLDPVSVNFSRLAYVALSMWPAALFTAPSPGILAAVFSGLITLVVGDSLYFYAISKVGGSIAAPLAYTYIIIAQYFALLLGESVSHMLFLSSILIVVGVALLTKGGEARLSVPGLLAAAGTALTWSAGMSAIKLASLGGVHPVAIAYLRATSAAAALGLYGLLTRRIRVVKSLPFAAASVLDLGVGSALFALSVERTGLSLTTIVVSLSPLIAQLYAKATGLESLTAKQILGGVAVFTAVATAVATG